MHDTALLTGEAFFREYVAAGDRVLDVGSMDVNGTLKPFTPVGASYTGCDLAEGRNVDVVLDDPYRLPFRDGEFTVSVSTSCFEHVEFFWLTFAEMARVTSRLVYVNAPIGGVVHRHPVDCWRFYPDAGVALAHWAQRNNTPFDLLESFVLPAGAAGWSDFVAVFAREPDKPTPRLRSCFPQAYERR